MILMLDLSMMSSTMSTMSSTMSTVSSTMSTMGSTMSTMSGDDGQADDHDILTENLDDVSYIKQKH